ncbi:flagellar hook-basal body complex protein FliE [Aestuariibius sp. 2305UL40-4]|uniref:flagellar hook-basal body complex protein FliE n=1 Tax=Aestuariibius violaceus TaxID=3234132 RepID=UPI00345ED76B
MELTSALAARSYLDTRPATAPEPGGLASAAQSFAATLQESEATATAALTSGADPHSLVQALAQTELAIETAVTIRDRVVEAYQEILRMPV